MKTVQFMKNLKSLPNLPLVVDIGDDSNSNEEFGVFQIVRAAITRYGDLVLKPKDHSASVPPKIDKTLTARQIVKFFEQKEKEWNDKIAAGKCNVTYDDDTPVPFGELDVVVDVFQGVDGVEAVESISKDKYKTGEDFLFVNF